MEYWPSVWETFISLGIWALGGIVFTVLAKVAIAIQSGELRAPWVDPHGVGRRAAAAE